MKGPSRVITSALRDARRNVALGKLSAFEAEAVHLSGLVQCEPSSKQAVVGGLIEIAELNDLCHVTGRQWIEQIVSAALSPAPPIAPKAVQRPYRTPQSTTDAFWYVVRNEPDRLPQWLADHKQDAPYLRELLLSREAAE